MGRGMHRVMGEAFLDLGSAGDLEEALDGLDQIAASFSGGITLAGDVQFRAERNVAGAFLLGQGSQLELLHGSAFAARDYMSRCVAEPSEIRQAAVDAG